MRKPIVTKPSRRLENSYAACLERIAPGLISGKGGIMADRRFRKVNLRLTVFEDTYARIEVYAKRQNLSLDLALNDLISFGLHGEGIFLDDSPDDAPPVGEPKEL